MKVLTLGHSLAVDSGHMLNLVADAEGYDQPMEIATLYYSGCQLWRHVQYLQANSPEYRLYMSSSKTPDQPPATTDGVTMETALRMDYWDIIVMQAGVFEAGRPDDYNGNVQIITDYVLSHQPEAKLMWNMTWAAPEDETLLNDSYKSNFKTYFFNISIHLL